MTFEQWLDQPVKAGFISTRRMCMTAPEIGSSREAWEEAVRQEREQLVFLARQQIDGILLDSEDVVRWLAEAFAAIRARTEEVKG